MGKILKHNITLRQDEPYGEVVSLLKGTELPDWAESLVGEHVFEEFVDEEPKRQSREIPTVKKKAEEKPENPVPSRGASVPEWKSFAKKAGIKDIPTSITRDELIAKVEEEFPDIEIED